MRPVRGVSRVLTALGIALGGGGFLGGEAHVKAKGVSVEGVPCTSSIHVNMVGEIYRNGKIDQYRVTGNFQPYPYPGTEGSCHTMAGVPVFDRIGASGMDNYRTRNTKVVNP